MFKKVILIFFIFAAIALLSVFGYYLYLNVFNNQYEFTYELQQREDWEPCCFLQNMYLCNIYFNSHNHEKVFGNHDTFA